MTAETELKAGRALDAEIAEKVMGAKWNRVPTKAESGMDFREDEWLQFSEGNWVLAVRFASGNVRVSPPCKSYSTSIVDAWSVVEKLSDDWYVQVHNYFRPAEKDGLLDLDGPDQKFWVATFEGVGPNDVLYSEEADTPALAICLASLSALKALRP